VEDRRDGVIEEIEATQWTELAHPEDGFSIRVMTDEAKGFCVFTNDVDWSG
jgi:NADPH-dependent 7-cyano-7-deazaguanine reductase QueF